MKKFQAFLLVVVFALLCLFSFFVPGITLASETTETKQPTQITQEQLKTFYQRLLTLRDELQKALESYRANLTELQLNLESLNSEIESLQNKLEQSKAELEKLSQQLMELQSEFELLSAQLLISQTESNELRALLASSEALLTSLEQEFNNYRAWAESEIRRLQIGNWIRNGLIAVLSVIIVIQIVK